MQTRRKGLSIFKDPNLTIAKLYDTNIVTINYGDNTITLDDSGWLTRHTKNCMNDILKPFGIYVYQHNKVWFIVTPYKVDEYSKGMKLLF